MIDIKERILNLTAQSIIKIDVVDILALNEEAMRRNNIQWCDEVEWQRIEVATKTEALPEYRYGFEGQPIEHVKSRSVRILESRRMILRKRAGELTWIETPDASTTTPEHER